MQRQQRNQLSQNFLYNRKLVRNLVGKSSIVNTDKVLEIGPGKGFITRQLLDVAGSVVAVEVDPRLTAYLRNLFSQDMKLWLFQQDFLDFPLPDCEYKTFSNIPFAAEGKIIRKLLSAKIPPSDSYLIIRKDLAERLSGTLHENQFSLKHKPRFEFSVVHEFKGTDFVPATKVSAVLWRIEKRAKSLISQEEESAWGKLIGIGFGNGESLRKSLGRVVGEKSFNQMADDLGIGLNIKPSYLSFEDWLAIYEYLKERRPPWLV